MSHRTLNHNIAVAYEYGSSNMGAISNFHDFTKMIFVYGNICDGFGNSYPNYPVGFKRQVLMDHTFIRLPNHNENLPFKTVLLMRLEDCLKKYQNFTIVFPEAETFASYNSYIWESEPKKVGIVNPSNTIREMLENLWDQVHSDKTKTLTKCRIYFLKELDQKIIIPIADWNNHIVLEYEKIHIDFRLISALSKNEELRILQFIAIVLGIVLMVYGYWFDPINRSWEMGIGFTSFAAGLFGPLMVAALNR